MLTQARSLLADIAKAIARPLMEGRLLPDDSNDYTIDSEMMECRKSLRRSTL